MKTFIFNVSLICLTLLFDCVSSIPSYFMDEMCGQTIDMNAKQIESGHLLLRRPESTGIRNRNCALTIRSPNGKQLVFKFQEMYLETPFGCDRDYVEIFEGSYHTNRSLIGKHCGSLPPMVDFNTFGPYALIAFSRYTTFFHDQFSLTFTAYHRGVCRNDEFTCNNGRCIHRDLRCDEFDNCGDESDICALSTGGIVGIVLACVLVVIIVAVIAACIFFKKRKSTNQQSRIDFHSSQTNSQAPRGAHWFPGYVSTHHQPYLHRQDSHKLRLLDPSELEPNYRNEQEYNHGRRFQTGREFPEMMTYTQSKDGQKSHVNGDGEGRTDVYFGSSDLHSSLVPARQMSNDPQVWLDPSGYAVNRTTSYARSLDRKTQRNPEIIDETDAWTRGSKNANIYNNNNYYIYNSGQLNRKSNTKSDEDPAVWIRRSNNADIEDNNDQYSYNAQSWNRKSSGKSDRDPTKRTRGKKNSDDVVTDHRRFREYHRQSEEDGETGYVYNGQSSWPRTLRNELIDSDRKYGYTQSLDRKLHQKSTDTDDPEVWIRIPKDDKHHESNEGYSYSNSAYHDSETIYDTDARPGQDFERSYRDEDLHYGYSLPSKKSKRGTAQHDSTVWFSDETDELEYSKNTRSLDRTAPGHLRHVDATGLARGYSFSTYRGMKPYVISFRSYPSPPPIEYTNVVYDSGKGQRFKSAMKKKDSGKFVYSDKTLYSRDTQQDEIYHPDMYTSIYR